jgi:type IV pilus assembly protein PilY1
MSRATRLALGLMMLALALFGVRQLRVHAFVGAAGASCVGDINRLTNPSGFTSADFSTSNAVVVPTSGASAIALDTNQVPLDPQHIVLPFDQDVTVKYVYRNAGASHMLGWFYLDQLKTGTKPFVKTVSGVDTLADWDSDGVPDWFQTAKNTARPLDGLWHISGNNTAPDLSNSGYTYKDQTSFYYGHIPHVLETLSGVANSNVAADHAADFIFKNCDDDSDTSSWPSGSGYTPAADVSTAVDGIPDYDVNADGIVGNEADRSSDLGTVQGNREIVFFAVTLYGSALHRAGLGLTGTGSDITTDSQPWFTKNLLNPDRGGYAAGTVLQKQAIGCARDDSTCYLAQNATLGWLDATTIARLNTAPYNYLHLDNTVNTIAVGADGSVPHFVVNAPSTDPNRWIMALDDQPEYPGASDSDYNDVVFLIERTNGGIVVSNNLVQTSDIPTGSTASDYMISKIRLRFSATYPTPGCTGVTDANIQIFWSVDNVNWYPAGFPVGATSGDLTINVLNNGIIGHQVYWKANFISSSQYCQPKLNSLNVGYEALQHGEYKFGAPVPVANVVFAGSLETSSSQWTVTRNDYRSRGHFYSSQLFNPTTLVDSSTLNWDAATMMNGAASSTRQGIFTSVAGTGVATPWNAANAATLYSKILNGTDRTTKSNGTLVFDFNGDGVTNDLDASYIMEWTRGLEYPQTPPTGSTTTTERAWKLGAIHNSSPAIIGTPGHPAWLDGTNATLGTFKTSYNGTTWLGDTTGVMARRTLALVGSQDGMLHAFDAGNFHNANELVCATQAVRLARGCFAPSGGSTTPDYGTGKEVFAYIPPTLLNAMKNNVGPVFGTAAYPEAEVDGSVAVDDIYYQPSSPVTGNPNNQMVTAAFTSLGEQWDAITAIGWTRMTYGGTTPVSTPPFPLWKQDWIDTDYRGSALSPAVGVATTAAGTRWVVATTSGLAQPAISGTVDEYAFFIDASNGTTITNGKVGLDTTGSTAYGFASFPNLVDSDGDGVNDRAYMVDTAGRIFRVNLPLLTKCQVGTLGEPVFSGMAVNVLTTTGGSPVVRLYVGGGANPDGTNTPAKPSALHIFALEDDDPVSGATCSTAKLVYKYATPGNQSTWAAPFIAGGNVFVATSSSTEQGVCALAAGQLLGVSADGNGATTNPQPSAVATPVPLANSAASSISIYDGHAFINGVSQETAVVGGGSWNNLPSGAGTSSGVSLKTLHWTEQ